MFKNVTNFLFNFDLIGPSPKLYIFNKERYQSVFSLIFSLLIIIISLVFILYSIVNYIINDRPTVIYSKSNDKNEERKINIKDTLIMFQLMEHNTLKKINESFAYFTAKYTAIYNTGEYTNLDLKITNCKVGVNINSKYEQFFKERFSILSFEYNQYGKKIEDFYCIDVENNNITLFYHPDIGYSHVNINVIIKNQNSYVPENISLMLIYENNLINHDNKEYPISEGFSYQFQDFSSNEYVTTNYNFQYLKYETDDGLFLNSLKYLNGMSFLDLNYYRNNLEEDHLQKNYMEKNSSEMGNIILLLNQSNYDYYRRTYKKIQALIAEIMSIVSLLFEIGRQIMEFLNQKKMSVDIIRKLFECEIPNKIRNKQTNFGVHDSDRIKIIPEKMNNSFKLNEKNNISNSTFDNIDDENNKKYKNKNEYILKQINILNIIKSFFCKSYKDKLIELCDNIIIKDMCVETILERFYNLRRIYNSILDNEKYNLGLTKEPKFRELISLINAIDNQTKIRKSFNNNNKRLNLK